MSSNGQALARIADAAVDELPDPADVVAVIDELIKAEDSGALDELRSRAEAAALYAKRGGYVERERHFGVLRLLTEAGIGVLSYDAPAVVREQRVGVLANYRALAAAFERGRLVEVAKGARTLSTSDVVNRVRLEGLTRVPSRALGEPAGASIVWKKARLTAREHSIPLASLPCDPSWGQEAQRRWVESRRRIDKLVAAKDRLDRMSESKHTSKLAKETGPRTATAYGLLRRALQSLHDAQPELRLHVRTKELDDVFRLLHAAEDAFGAALRAEQVGRANSSLIPFRNRE